MSLKHRLRRLQREAEQGGIILRQRDGTSKVFDEMTCHAAMFVAHMDLAVGRAQRLPAKEVLDAVRSATPESRREFEERFGSICMSAHIIAADYQGGWVKERNLLEDGTVEETFHEGGSEEAERIRQEARERKPHELH